MEIFLKESKKNRLILLVLLFFLTSLFFIARGQIYAEDDIEDIKDDMSSVEKKLEKEKKNSEDLKKELGKIQWSVSNTSKEIEKTQGHIETTEENIKRKEGEINLLDKKNEIQKAALVGLLREAYYLKKDFGNDMIISGKNFSEIFSNADRFVSLEEKIFELIEEIKTAKERINYDQKELIKTKGDHEKLLEIKARQQNEFLADKKEVQLEIMEKEKMIAKLSSRLNDLKAKYSAILGKNISTDDILEAAKFAAKETKMNKSFLLGVLVQESNKGQFTGGCDYKESKMSSYRLEIFKDICEELKYDYKKKKVSCPPKSYKGTGGAMGVAQFMPDTWQGYKKSITSLTGNNPPDPWSLIDGVTAMAIKLSRDGASKKTRFEEAKSYCIYLAGGNWGHYCFGKDKYKDSYEGYNCWGSSIRNYGEKVLCLKDNYEKYY